MKLHGRVSISYADRVTRLDRLRAVEEARAKMAQQLAEAQAVWSSSDQTMDARRDSCTAVAVILFQFALAFGLPEFARDRLNDLDVGLGELLAGRTSALLRRADVPTRTPAATDLVNQAIAQVCVDVLRDAGVSAGEARKRTARLFLERGFKNFSVSKIKHLGSRLKGAGASLDAAFGEYQMVHALAANMADSRKARLPVTESSANGIARDLVAKAAQMDHRLGN